MIIISITILCANVLKSFFYTFPKNSQVKFSYLVYFLVDLDGKKYPETKTNKSFFQIKRIPKPNLFSFSFLLLLHHFLTHGVYTFSPTFSEQSLPCWHFLKKSGWSIKMLNLAMPVYFSWFPVNGQRASSPLISSYLEQLWLLRSAHTHINTQTHTSQSHAHLFICFLTSLLPVDF